MKRCVRCLMPETKPGITFDSDGLCAACTHSDAKKGINYEGRREHLQTLCDRFRRSDGYYDCLIPVSGGKDSMFQTWVMRELYGMNPLLVCVTDNFDHTKAGAHNYWNIAETFGCDMITLTLNPDFVRRMTRLSFEALGSTNWAVDKAIYAWPIWEAIRREIPLVVYGEDVTWEYGGVFGEESSSAKRQINNDVVKAAGEVLKDKVEDREWNMMSYPSEEQIEAAGLEPIFLGYFFDWSDPAKVDIAKRHGMKTLQGEWDRAGYIEDYIQIDTVGYLMNYFLKYVKLGIGRATDAAGYMIREGTLTTEEARALIRTEDGKLDQRILDDFLRVTGYSIREFWAIIDRWWNEDVFERTTYGTWRMKDAARP